MVEKRSINDVVFNIFNYTFFILFTIICVFPFYYLFINTISDQGLVSKGLINFYPRGINIKNYIALRNVHDLGSSFIVTLARTIIGTATSTLVSGFVGYLVTKKELWHRKIAYRFMIITMYFNAGLIPWFTTMQMLGLTNNFMAYIIPGLVSVYNIIMVKTYIESIPAELEESANLDGCNDLQTLWKIVLPLSGPVLATFGLFYAVGHWNSYFPAMIYLTDDKMYPLQLILRNIIVTAEAAAGDMSLMDPNFVEPPKQSIKMAVIVVATVPIMCVYPFLQKYFVKGVMVGALKG